MFPRLLLILAVLLPALAQAQEPTTQPAATQPTTQPAPAIDLADIPTQADTAATALEDITRGLESNPTIDNIASALPALAQQITTHLAETSRLLTPSVSLDILRTQERDWLEFRETLADHRKELNDRQADLETYARRLSDLEKSWSATAAPLRVTTRPSADEAAAATTRASSEVLARVESILRDIRRAQAATARQRTGLLSLQSQLSVLEVRTSEMLLTLRRASERAFSRLLSPDSPPLWAPLLKNYKPPVSVSLTQQGSSSFRTQVQDLQTYVARNWVFFIRHAVIVALLAGALIWIRKRVQHILASDPSTAEEAQLFDVPFATAIVSSMLMVARLYPVAPRLFYFLLGSLVLIPTAKVLRRIVIPAYAPLLSGTILFTFIGLSQSVIASLPTLSRYYFLLEMIGAAAFLVWFLYGRRRNPANNITAKEIAPANPAGHHLLAHPYAKTAVALALRLALALTLVSAVANILGYVGLAKLLANTLVVSAYIAMILHAGVVLADTLVLGAMAVKPIGALRMVKNRGATVRLWLHRLFVTAAVCYWIQRTLSLLSVWDRTYDATARALRAEVKAGALTLSLGGVLNLAIAILIAIALSRFVRFLLEEDVYPRVKLAKGIPYAISTMIHYIVLLLGFLTAISQIYDMTQFTILASAFGIGLGFGLQNIVNNFVSGLILLFERPIRVGDIIELGNQSATVTRIGIRASVVRLNNAAEIIIPNGQLISEKVTNWTLSNRQRGLELNLAIAPSDTHTPPQILELLCREASANPLIAQSPTPKAVITAMSGDSFTYQLRAWTNKYEDWTTVRSQLLESLHAKLKAEGLTLK